MEITLKLAGSKPLLLGSVTAADPRTKEYQRMQELRAIKSANRTPAWFDEMEHLQFMSAFYPITEVKGVAIPAENIRRSLAEAGRVTRDKPKALRAIRCNEVAVSLMYEGWQQHWTPAQLYDHPQFRLTKVQRTKAGASLNTWPKFDDWGLSVSLDLDEEVMGETQFWTLADRAGRIEGLGACRSQGYGRYVVKKPGNGA